MFAELGIPNINEIIELNKKIQNDTFDIIKRTDQQIYDKIVPESFIKIIESNNKKIFIYISTSSSFLFHLFYLFLMMNF
jgi:predicted PurR-regulated permease PerM